ncbi:hypothetical protein MIMGU_mgv11b023661mg, partial [Erythranthe guttata]
KNTKSKNFKVFSSHFLRGNDRVEERENMARYVNMSTKSSSSWMAVAPSPIIFPHKPSNTPDLETIVEEIEEEDDDS